MTSRGDAAAAAWIFRVEAGRGDAVAAAQIFCGAAAPVGRPRPRRRGATAATRDPRRLDISPPEVQTWLGDQLEAFLDQTGAAGFAWDHDIYAGPSEKMYAQWRSWMAILKRLRAHKPDIVMDHRQTNHIWGPWYQLAGSYAEPLAGDENPETYATAQKSIRSRRRRRGYAREGESRRRRGRDADRPWTGRGDAAASTRCVPWRRRRQRACSGGDDVRDAHVSSETRRGGAAAATRTYERDPVDAGTAALESRSSTCRESSRARRRAKAAAARSSRPRGRAI